MWDKGHSVPSQYPDTFDYGMYDRLYERFGDQQPRGGVVYKGTMKLLEAQDCAQCFHRFEIDTYGRGCVHNCAYCYAKSYLSIRRYWNEPIPFPMDIAAIRKIFATVFETSKHSKFRHILERRVPLRLGSMSDAFMWIDKKYRVTLELLKMLKFYHYPYLIDAMGESFQRYQPLWSNRADCCDAVGNVQAFQTMCASLQRSSFKGGFC